MPPKGFPRRITDFRAKTLTLQSPPQRVVSLTPGITEVLFAIGAGKQVAGVTSYCDYPVEAKRLPKVGDMRTNVEAVVALRPDLVIADGILNRRYLPALERLKLPLLVVTPKGWMEVARMIRLLGEATGHPEQAEALAQRFQQAQRDARRHASSTTKPSVLFALNVEPLPVWVAGRETFVHDMIRLAGGRNAAEDGGTNYYPLSAEALLRRAPDILLVTLPEDQLAPLYEHPVLRRLRAVQTRQVYSVDSNLFVRPTPRLLQGLDWLKSVIERTSRG